jgi:hypothetical protein
LKVSHACQWNGEEEIEVEHAELMGADGYKQLALKARHTRRQLAKRVIAALSRNSSVLALEPLVCVVCDSHSDDDIAKSAGEVLDKQNWVGAFGPLIKILKELCPTPHFDVKLEQLTKPCFPCSPHPEAIALVVRALQRNPEAASLEELKELAVIADVPRMVLTPATSGPLRMVEILSCCAVRELAAVELIQRRQPCPHVQPASLSREWRELPRFGTTYPSHSRLDIDCSDARKITIQRAFEQVHRKHAGGSL